MSDTNPDLIAEGRRLLADATKRPWLAAAKPSSIVGWPIVSTGAGGRSVCSVTWAQEPGPLNLGAPFNRESDANAALIAFAVNNLPALLDAYEEREKARASENHIGAAEREVGQFVYRRIDKLMDAQPGTPEGAELVYLARIVSDVEEYGATGAESPHV